MPEGLDPNEVVQLVVTRDMFERLRNHIEWSWSALYVYRMPDHEDEIPSYGVAPRPDVTRAALAARVTGHDTNGASA